MVKNEETNKPFYIRFKPSYMENIEAISEKTGLAKSKVMNEILASYFEDKVLTNDFIKLDNPFYFNMNELKEQKTVRAVEKIPTYKRDEGYLVYSVPNNLDSFDNELKTYCSGTATNHKGIYIDYVVTTSDIKGEDRLFSKVVEDITENYFIFDYDSSAKTLDVSLVPFEDLYLYVPIGSSILEDLEAEKDEFYNNIILDEKTNVLNEIELLSKSINVLHSYKAVKQNRMFLESEEGKEMLKTLEALEKESEKLGVIFSDNELSGAEHKKNYKELKESEKNLKEVKSKYLD